MANLFWDSCVFSALLYDETASYNVADIQQYLEEAKTGTHKIYTSSIVFAEIATSKIKKTGVGKPIDFFNDLNGACVVIDASVNIIELAGRICALKREKPVHPTPRLEGL